jgi:hypothetical protein
MSTDQTWELWIAGVGARGASFARGRMAAATEVLAHALPDSLDVDVFDDDGVRLLTARNLRRTDSTPMARLTVDGTSITRADIWPEPTDQGLPVILMGGEIGILTSWWHAADHSAWRWSIELSNHR